MAVAPSADLRCPTCGHVERSATSTQGGSARDAARDAAELERAEVVRRALVEAALGAYEDAGLSGLCAEGRWEAAMSALRALDVTGLAAERPPPSVRHSERR